ncbi:MAG: helix-turn-helix domain-containing protein [Candidatus Omnitrophota bacterium]|nr:MAG: helix-turn-helix domain-containing protein [Candidatus Omnitrophota bacterium]
MSRLMDVDELAAYLKLQKQTIYNWLHAKKISGIKVGHVWRFDKRAVDAWLRSQIREARTEAEQKKSSQAKKGQRK